MSSLEDKKTNDIVLPDFKSDNRCYYKDVLYKFNIMWENTIIGHFKVEGSLLFKYPNIGDQRDEKDCFVRYYGTIKDLSWTSEYEKNTKYPVHIFFWSRFIGGIRSYNVIIPPSCGFPRGCRERIYREAIMLSVANYGLCPSDHFWYNPSEEFDFQFQERNVHMKPTTWEEVNPYQHFVASKDLYGPIFYDDIGNCEINDIKDYLFSTPGDRAKRWIQYDDIIYLEKRPQDRKYFEKEVLCLEFFKKRNIIVPNYELLHKSKFTFEEQNCGYYSDTMKTGIDIIRKQCLTDLNSELVPMSRFLKPSLSEMLQQFQIEYNIDKTVIDDFKAIVQEYVKQNNVQFVDYNNFGFIRKGNEYLPVVWSNVDKYVFLWYQKSELPISID